MEPSFRKVEVCLTVLAALMLSVAGCSKDTGNASSRDEDEATIRRLDAEWVKTAAAKDVDGWIAFYADEVAVLPPNDRVATDRASIRRAVSELLSLPGLQLSWTPTKVEVAQSGDIAYLYGAYSLKMNDEKGRPVRDVGKNVEIWKRQPSGKWKCIVDTWNSDLPAASAAAK